MLDRNKVADLGRMLELTTGLVMVSMRDAREMLKADKATLQEEAC